MTAGSPLDRLTWPIRTERRLLADILLVELDAVIVGYLMLRIEGAWTQAEVAEQGRGVQAELGWVLDPAYGGRGLATEAVQALIRISFEELGLRRVTASRFAANEASLAIDGAGRHAPRAATVRDSLHRTEGWLERPGVRPVGREWSSSQGGG